MVYVPMPATGSEAITIAIVQEIITHRKQILGVNLALGLMEKIKAMYRSAVKSTDDIAAFTCPNTHKKPINGQRRPISLLKILYSIVWRKQVRTREYTPRKKSLTAKFETNSIVGTLVRDLFVRVVANTIMFNRSTKGAKKYSA